MTTASCVPGGRAGADGSPLIDSWLRSWSSDGSRLIVHDQINGWLRADELEEHSRVAAGRLCGRGLQVGERVLLAAHPSTRWVVAYVGALRAGLTVVAIDANCGPTEARRIVEDSMPRVAIVVEPRLADVAARTPGVVVVPDIDALPPSDGPPPRIAPDAVAMLAYTSGTTGEPKGAMLTHRNLSAGADSLQAAWRWTPDDCLLHTLPLAHMHGLGIALTTSLCIGSAVMLRPRFDASDVLRGPVDLGATLFFGVPTMYSRLLRHGAIAELGRYRLCVSGSAALPVETFHETLRHGRQRILERYGMTETLVTVSNPYDGERRPGSVGRPLPGVDVRLGAGDEIEVRGPTVFSGYWQQQGSPCESWSAGDEWFRTGDIGQFDDDGYLRLVGRSSDLIISGGHNVYPREVEDVLMAHPRVTDVAVKGVRSEEWGEAVTAWVASDGDLAVEDVLTFARAHLAPHKCPKVVHLVDAVPRNAIGKVLRRDLD